MPSKSICPNCGQKSRGAAHLCDPMKVDREDRRQSILTKLAQRQK